MGKHGIGDMNDNKLFDDLFINYDHRGADVYSDHNLIIGQLRIELQLNYQQQKQVWKMEDVAKLRYNEVVADFITLHCWYIFFF